jgi:uncharacterized membrane protein
MSVVADVLAFITVFCGGIATGTWVVAQRALIPMRRELSPEGAIQLHVVTSREIDRYQPQCTAIATVAGFLILALGLAPDRASALWTGAGFLCMLGASLVSVLRNMPINKRIASWPTGTVPAEYAEIQSTWNRGNLARTLMGLVGFASYVLAVI